MDKKKSIFQKMREILNSPPVDYTPEQHLMVLTEARKQEHDHLRSLIFQSIADSRVKLSLDDYDRIGTYYGVKFNKEGEFIAEKAADILLSHKDSHG